MENEVVNQRFMTVREVSEAMGVSADTIKNCIRRIMPSKMVNGKTTYLDESEVACISKELKNNSKVIGQLTYEAGSQVKSTVTDLEIIANAVNALKDLQELYQRKEKEYKEIIAHKDSQLLEQKPKVEWFDNVANSENLTEIGTVGKMVGIGARKIFTLLKGDKIIQEKYSDGIRYYIPYSNYDRYFASIPTPFIVGDKTFTRNKLMFNQKGVIWATKKYKEK